MLLLSCRLMTAMQFLQKATTAANAVATAAMAGRSAQVVLTAPPAVDTIAVRIVALLIVASPASLATATATSPRASEATATVAPALIGQPSLTLPRHQPPAPSIRWRLA